MFGKKIIKKNISVLEDEDLIAKSVKKSDGTIDGGIGVKDHCYIVGLVAKELISRYPYFISSLFFPSGSSLVVSLHDIGKAYPVFQKRIHTNLTNPKEGVLKALSDVSTSESDWSGHSGVSQATLEYFDIKFIPEIAGRHHGTSPVLVGKKFNSEIFGGEEWFAKRKEIIEYLKEKLEEDFPVVNDPISASVLTGLTTVSDWIGSAYCDKCIPDNLDDLVKSYVDDAGYIKPKVINNLGFYDIFGFNENESQKALIESIKPGGLYLLEAGMGTGKTEASLYAAYKILEQDMCTGIYFALPTQLTSNKINSRVESFLEKILEEDSLHRASVLVHGKSKLIKQIMNEDAKPGGEWFSKGKKGILAPFAVGTIDQALLSVLNVKHNSLRTFGLLGKVVILDEVHSYDAYTGTVVDLLIEELLNLKCTVIVLSATLSNERKNKLFKKDINSEAYPLVSCFNNEYSEKEVIVNDKKDISISIEDNDQIVFRSVIDKAKSGQQVLWIENTVQDAQNIFSKLSSVSNEIEVGLIHSRFLFSDREEREGYWTNVLGKGNKDRNKKGRILIGTQVLEQSIDIDSDLLITRIAPIDMILQRIGRLWRHKNPNRALGSKQDVIVLSRKITSEDDYKDKSFFGLSSYVYSPYVLFRTLEVLSELDLIKIPNDMRKLINNVYNERKEEGALSFLLNELRSKKEKLESIALRSSGYFKKELDEDVSTRYSEQDTVEVLLVKSIAKVENGVFLVFLNNEKVFLPKFNSDYKSMANISLKISQNILKVSASNAFKQEKIDNLKWLSEYYFIGRGEYSLLRVAVVKEEELFDIYGNKIVESGYFFSYNSEIGYKKIKNI